MVESPAVVDGDQEEDETARHAQEQQHGPGHHARALQGGLSLELATNLCKVLQCLEKASTRASTRIYEEEGFKNLR